MSDRNTDIRNIINKLDTITDNICESNEFNRFSNNLDYYLVRKKYYYIKKIKYNILYNNIKNTSNILLIQKYLTKINGYNHCLNLIEDDICNIEIEAENYYKINELNKELKEIDNLYFSYLLDL